MKEIGETLEAWLKADCQIALVTVVEVEGAAPRLPEATMAVNERGEVISSVSGGCVEAAAYAEALEVLRDGPPRLLTYGIQDEDAYFVGLTCGGTLRLFVERLDWAGAAAIAARGARGGGPGGPSSGLDGPAAAVPGSGGEEAGLFIQAFTPPPRFFVFGAIDFAGALVDMGKYLGNRVILCGPRPVFASRARFPEADEVIVAWPHEYLTGAGVGVRMRSVG